MVVVGKIKIMREPDWERPQGLILAPFFLKSVPELVARSWIKLSEAEGIS
jgi:hypothetical protein